MIEVGRQDTSLSKPPRSWVPSRGSFRSGTQTVKTILLLLLFLFTCFSLLIARFCFAAVVFSFEETTEAIEHFLRYSVIDRTFKTLRGGGEIEVEPEVQVAEEEEMEGKNFDTCVLPFLYVFKRATL